MLCTIGVYILNMHKSNTYDGFLINPQAMKRCKGHIILEISILYYIPEHIAHQMSLGLGNVRNFSENGGFIYRTLQVL